MRKSRRQTRVHAVPALALCGLLLAPAGAFGQQLRQETAQRVSLAEALEAFARNSLALRIARSETAELTGAARQSRTYFNPAFSFGRDDLSHQNEKIWEETFHISQQVEWPGRTAARGRIATHAIGAGAARFRADSTELAFEVREAYAKTWLAEETESIARQTAAIIQEVTEDAENRLESGDISAYDARRLRIERATASMDVEEAELRARDARRMLAALIAPGTGTDEIGPSEALDGTPPVIAREAAMHALSQRPDVEAAMRELQAASAGVQVAQTYWVPEPTLGVGYRHHDDGFGGASIALDLPLPLFDRGAGARQEATAQHSAAAYRLDLTSQLAEYDLLTASDRYGSARARLASMGPNLRADSEALLASATTAYAENEMTLLDILDAANTFKSAQLSVLSLTSEAWISYYNLLRAMGSAPENER